MEQRHNASLLTDSVRCVVGILFYALVKVSDWNSFRTNQIHSDSFRNLFPRQSELIRVNPKKNFNLVWCNLVKNQSVSIRVNPRFLILSKIQSEAIRLNPRLPIRINPKEVLNPNESEVRVIYTEYPIRSNPKNSDLGFIRIERLVRIHSDSKSRIDSNWDGLNFNRITSNEIKIFFRIDSDEFGLAGKQISE